MSKVIQYRLPDWQAQAFRDFSKKHGISMSTMSRFCFNYILLKYRGRISLKLIDKIEFEALKRFRKPVSRKNLKLF